MVKQRVAIIVQARLESTRLPAKTMLQLPCGRTVIKRVVAKCDTLASKITNVCTPMVVVAVPYGDQGDIIRWHLKGVAQVVSGDADDVLARYHKVADWADADHVVRITSDCPMIDPDICCVVVRSHLSGEQDYTSNVYPTRTYPKGYDCEVFTRKALDRADIMATDPYDREHVTPLMQRMMKTASVTSVVDRSGTRLTLDTIYDYMDISKVIMNTESW
jgi:spore coat polysaccharide biosynthesis protein SpsF